MKNELAQLRTTVERQKVYTIDLLLAQFITIFTFITRNNLLPKEYIQSLERSVEDTEPAVDFGSKNEEYTFLAFRFAAKCLVALAVKLRVWLKYFWRRSFLVDSRLCAFPTGASGKNIWRMIGLITSRESAGPQTTAENGLLPHCRRRDHERKVETVKEDRHYANGGERCEGWGSLPCGS